METKVRILVLDDEQIVLESMARILSEENFDVHTCKSGFEALELAEKNTYDIFITDIKMPKMGGLEVMKNLVARHNDLSVIVITGYPTVENALEAMKGGAIDYIQKPFTPEELLKSVMKVMKSRETTERNNALLNHYAELTKNIAAELSLKKVLDMVAQGLPRLLEVEGSAVSLIDRKSRQLRMVSSSGLSLDYLNKGPIDADKSIPTPDSKTQYTLVTDIKHDERLQYPKEAEREGITSILSIPLRIDSEPIGIMRAYRRTNKPYTENELIYAVRLSEFTSSCVKKASSYQDVKDEYDALRDDLWAHFDKTGWE